MLPPLPPRHRCPWFIGGLLLGLLAGLYLTELGMRTAPSSTPTALHSHG
jgi:hypothetical protein